MLVDLDQLHWPRAVQLLFGQGGPVKAVKPGALLQLSVDILVARQ